jgi:fibronectin type 3 domain-containing protein
MSVTAQNISSDLLSVNVKSIYTNDGNIVLRWAPVNYKTWKWGVDSGYILQRMTIAVNDTILAPTAMNESIITIHLLPKSQSEWESGMQQDSFIGVAAAASFGDNVTLSGMNNDGIFSIYDINSDRENRFGLSLLSAEMSTLAADIQNLYYLDTQVISGNRYSYLIKPGGNLGANTFKPGILSVNTSEPDTLPMPPLPIATPGDSVISLKWSYLSLDGFYSSYNIFISIDSGNTFKKINFTPIVPLSTDYTSEEIVYHCRIADNSNLYCFKIQGHSPFGIDGPFSQPVCQTGKPAPLTQPIWIDSLINVDEDVKIMWSFPDTLSNKISGFNVLRAPSYEKPYIKINTILLNPDVRYYIDLNPLPTAYYKIEYVDVNTNSMISLPVIYQAKDSIPPDAPQNVSAIPVGNGGMIKIHWNPSISPDVMGYRVFMSDQASGSFGQITSKWVSDTVFFYKINTYTLSDKKYYKVKAIDFRENSSDFSSLCTADIPDAIPPSKPVIINTKCLQEAIVIEFNPSLSKDVERHEILRRKKGYSDWVTIAIFDSLSVGTTSFSDTTADDDVTYEYIVQSLDDASNKSNSKPVYVKNTNAIKSAPINVSISFVKSKNHIEMSWQYSNDFKANSFIIYRGSHPDTLKEIMSLPLEKVISGGEYNGPSPFGNSQILLPGSQITSITPNLQHTGIDNSNNGVFCKYEDKEFQRFTTYYYAIGVRFDNGSQSQISSPLSISTY